MATGNGRNMLVAFICILLTLVLAPFTSATTSALIIGSIVVFYSIIALKWHLRRSLWFWGVLVAFAIIHVMVAILLKIDLPRGPAISYVLPIVAVDIGGIYGLVSLLEKRLPATDTISNEPN